MYLGNILLAGVVLAAVVGCNRSAPVQAKQDTGPVKIRTMPVSSRDLQREVEAVGSLFPYEEVTISSEIDGRVEEVTADLGGYNLTKQVARGMICDAILATMARVEAHEAEVHRRCSCVDGPAKKMGVHSSACPAIGGP